MLTHIFTVWQIFLLRRNCIIDVIGAKLEVLAAERGQVELLACRNT